MKHIVIVGASGLLGSHIISVLLDKKDISIVSLVRKLTNKYNHLPNIKEIIFDFEKESDYHKIGSEILCDIFFCCIGTTIKASKSIENFNRVDKDYPIRFIEQIKKESPHSLFVFTSSIGVSNSRGYYLNAKCEVEKALTKSLLHYIISRPSILLGKRKEFRIAESIGGIILQKINYFLNKIKINEEFTFSKYAPIEAHKLAACMVHHALNFDTAIPGMILEGDNLKLD